MVGDEDAPESGICAAVFLQGLDRLSGRVAVWWRKGERMSGQIMITRFQLVTSGVQYCMQRWLHSYQLVVSHQWLPSVAMHLTPSPKPHLYAAIFFVSAVGDLGRQTDKRQERVKKCLGSPDTTPAM
jgi:hypothetical protein